MELPQRCLAGSHRGCRRNDGYFLASASLPSLPSLDSLDSLMSLTPCFHWPAPGARLGKTYVLSSVIRTSLATSTVTVLSVTAWIFPGCPGGHHLGALLERADKRLVLPLLLGLRADHQEIDHPNIRRS